MRIIFARVRRQREDALGMQERTVIADMALQKGNGFCGIGGAGGEDVDGWTIDGKRSDAGRAGGGHGGVAASKAGQPSGGGGYSVCAPCSGR